MILRVAPELFGSLTEITDPENVNVLIVEVSTDLWEIVVISDNEEELSRQQFEWGVPSVIAALPEKFLPKLAEALKRDLETEGKVETFQKRLDAVNQ